MPWAELGMNGSFDNWPLWLRWTAEHTPIRLPDYAAVSGLGADWTSYLQKNGAEGHLGDYAYSLVIGIALIGSAIGIAAIGREDAEEKTVLPVAKK
jgi:hypothetical protein